MQIHSKLPNVGTTIFTVMSGLATEQKAVNLGQGFPDYQMDEELTSLVDKAMKEGYNQYAPMPGWMPLRESIAEKVEFLYSNRINPDTEITITPGGTYAIYTALTTILEPGDEVIVFQPCYDSYIPNIEVNKAKPVLIDLKFPDYDIDWNLVKKSVTEKTKAIVINSPNNPTGRILRQKDIDELRELVKDKNIFIISDEVYEHLVFDDQKHLSMLKYPDLYARSFVCFSFGKVYNCTGWKLGYCITPAAYTKEFRKVHQFNCFSCFTPAQVALAEFLKNRDAYMLLGKAMQGKRDYFRNLMSSTKFSLLPSDGSYFNCALYDKISDEPASDFAIRITKEHKVAMIPVSAFYQNGRDDKVVRFCFSKKEETLEQAVARLAKI